MSNERRVSFKWIHAYPDIVYLERSDSVKGISKAFVSKNKLDIMFRDETGLGVAFVPQKYIDEFKLLKKVHK